MRAALAAGEFEELAGGRFRVLGHELEPDDVIVERDGQGGLVGRVDGRGHGRTRHDARRGAPARGAGQRARCTRSTRCAGTRVSSSPTGSSLTIPEADCRLLVHEDWIKAETLAVEIRLGASLVEKADDGSDPGGLTPAPTSPSRRELELAAELDRQAEGHVLLGHRERLDRLDTAGAEPVAGAGHELLRRRRARGDADRLDAVEPGLVDLGLVVDQVRLDAVRRGRLRRAGSSWTSCASRSRAGGRSRRASP